ncbi:MAG TPA: glycosyltransferase 87 family protein [Solirubrobacteraceae bacterium]|nr:glycosyltransferase 87 family protein [Solirubrobacteraceae bacterium]
MSLSGEESRPSSRWGPLFVVGIAAVIIVSRLALGTEFGFDYKGLWRGGHEILDGHSPYLVLGWRRLLLTGNAFVVPPLLGELSIPFSVLPFHVALPLWNLLSACGLAAALKVVGVRDGRVYLLAACSFPFMSSQIMGQPDGLFALAAALAWRYRDSWPGAVAVGVVIAAKLLAWPLVLWFLITRRIRSALISATSIVVLLLLSWAPIDFKGLLGYPRLLYEDARGFETRSHSFVALAMRLGASAGLSTGLATAIAIVVAAAVVRAARGSDLGWFAGAITLGLLVSPVLWTHYLVLLLVPLAISRPRFDWVWVLTGTAFVLSPVEPAHGWQIAVVLMTTFTIAVMTGSAARATRPPNIRTRSRAARARTERNYAT